MCACGCDVCKSRPITSKIAALPPRARNERALSVVDVGALIVSYRWRPMMTMMGGGGDGAMYDATIITAPPKNEHHGHKKHIHFDAKRRRRRRPRASDADAYTENMLPLAMKLARPDDLLFGCYSFLVVVACVLFGSFVSLVSVRRGSYSILCAECVECVR